jgi:hypothetical protein
MAMENLMKNIPVGIPLLTWTPAFFSGNSKGD